MSEVIPAGYRQTRMGVIPDDWRAGTLTDVATKITDGDHVTPRRAKYGRYLLSARNVMNCHLDLSDVDYVGEAEYDRMRARRGPEFGDVLISCSGTIGRVTMVPANIHCVLVRSVALVKLKRVLTCGKFVQYWMQGNAAQRQIANSVNQGAQPNLFLTHIEHLALPRPPLHEQRAIADALGDVDALLDALDPLIAKKRDLKQAAMQQLLTARTRLPGFTGEWAVVRLGDCLTFLKHGTNSRAELAVKGSVKYLHYGDIHGASGVVLDPGAIHMPYLPEMKARGLDRLKNGELVFADASEDVDRVGCSVELCGVGVSEVVSGMHTIAARFDEAVLANGFKGYLQFIPAFRDHLQRLAAGTKVYATNRAYIANAEMALPDIAEQIAIATVLSDMDAEIAALEARRAKTRDIKQAMMQELLTGRTRLV